MAGERASAPWRLLAGLALLAPLCGLGGCGQPAPAERPNILFISIDTLRADHLGTHGYARPTSPAIDAFAETAVVFEEAHSHTSWTLPSFATMLTSTYSQTHGCLEFSHRLDESVTTLPELLSAAGWHTGAVVSHVFVGRRHGLLQGITDIDDELQLEIMDSHEQISSPGVTRKGMQWIDARQAEAERRPWFLWLHYFDPHDTYKVHAETAGEFPGETELDAYDGEIAFNDLWLGRLFGLLERTGLERNTIVVLVSDHGEEFGEHGRQRHGSTLYREVLHVPLMIRAPGLAPRRVASVVRTVDIMPTLLDLVELPIPDFVQGFSLVRGMRGEALPSLPVYGDLRLRPDFLAESFQFNGWKLIVDHSGASRRTDATVSLDATGRRVQAILEPALLLFDVDADPGETRNLAAEQPELVERLLSLLDDARREARELRAAIGGASTTELQLDDDALLQLKQLGYLR